MRIMVQRRMRSGWILAVVLLFVSVAASAERTVVLPLVGVAGSCAYCEQLRGAIASADTSIDILLADGRLDGVDLWDEVIAASDRGVTVRVLLDRSDWAPRITDHNRSTIDYLNEHGIPARFDDPSVTTHAKLVVIDRRIVILGSTNWNRHSFHEQEQADVSIEDESVGEAFATYFDRLWDGTLFPGAVTLPVERISPDLPTIVPLPETDGTGNYPALLLHLISRARESIHVVMYRISYYAQYRESSTNDILNALIEASSRGLDVLVYMDDCAFYESDMEANLQAARYLADHGVEVRMDDPDVTTHAKLTIVDRRTVLLGSTNWNYYSIERNVEADIALLNIPPVASAYEAYFEALFDAGRPISP